MILLLPGLSQFPRRIGPPLPDTGLYLPRSQGDTLSGPSATAQSLPGELGLILGGAAGSTLP